MASLVLGLLSCGYSIWLVSWLFRGMYFRYTNLVMLISSLMFFVMTIIWWVITDDPSMLQLGISRIGWGIISIPLCGAAGLLCFFTNRWYTSKL